MDLFLEVNFILPEVLWPVLMGREQFFEHFPQKHLYGVPPSAGQIYIRKYKTKH